MATEEERPKTLAAAIRSAAPALALAVLLLAPFYDKAFTIDDTLFLREAAQILTDPLQPGAFDVVWDEEVPVRVSTGAFITGPVAGYLLAPSVWLGGSEPMAHAVSILLLCGAAIATAGLALRFRSSSWEAAAAAALLVSSPAVLAMASTNMPDVPAMAFGVMAFERYAAWTEERRPGQGWAAALLFAAALLTRAHMVLLLGVAGLAPLLHALRRDEKQPPRGWWLPLAGSLLMAAAFHWITWDRSLQTLEATETLRPLFNWYSAPRHLIAFGTHWMLAFPLGLAWLLLRGRDLRWWIPCCLLAALLIPLPRSAPRWTAPVAAMGFLVIGDVLWTAARRRDWDQVSLGLWLLLGIATLTYIHHPAKYEVPAAPAAALLIAHQLPRVTRLRQRWIVTACICGGAILGVAIVRADAVLAGLGRLAAAELIKPRVDAGARVWFAGHWGFQWYAEKAGARPVTRVEPRPQRGDLVVFSAVDGSRALSLVPRRTLLEQRAFSAQGGRVMSKQDQAGFYSDARGYLPWAWGSGEINRFEVWRVD